MVKYVYVAINPALISHLKLVKYLKSKVLQLNIIFEL